MNEADARELLKTIFEEGTWFRFPRRFLQTMSPTEAVMMSYLINLDFCTKPDEGGWFLCSRAKVEEDLNIPKDAQINAFRTLEDLKLIERKQDTKTIGHGRMFRVNLVRVFKLIVRSRESRTTESGITDKVVGNHGQGSRESRTCVTTEKVVLRKEEERNKPPARSARGSVRGGFLGDVVPLTLPETLSKKLEEALRVSRKFDPSSKTKQWPIEIQKLIDSGYTKKEVKDTLYWYIENLNEPYVPQAYSTKTFRSKYASIVAAMIRSSKPKEEKPEELVPTELERKLIEHIETLGWPKGSRSQVSNAVLLTYRRHVEWMKRSDKWEKWIKTQPMQDAEGWSNDNRRLARLHEYLQVINRNSYEFTRVWWTHRHQNLMKWEDWSGDLSAFIFHTEHKEFLRMGQAAAQEGGWGDMWETYIKSINEN